MRVLNRSRIVVGVLASALGGACDPAGEGGAPPPGVPGQVVFEASFSKEGRLAVLEGPDGSLIMAVTGRIGDDDHVATFGKLRPSLVDTFRALKPGEGSVPRALQELDARFMAQQVRAQNDRDGSRPEVLKNAISFIDAVCRQHDLGASAKAVVNHCRFGAGVTSVCTDWSVDGGDVTFAWNESPGSTVNIKSDLSGNPATFSYQGAWSWGYHWWSGSANQQVCQSTHSGTGDLGISHHDILASFP